MSIIGLRFDLLEYINYYISYEIKKLSVLFGIIGYN